MGILFRSLTRGTGILLTYPVAHSMEKLFIKNGFEIGTILLTFIFVNSNWALLFLGIGLHNLLQNIYPPLAHLGYELATGILVLLGTYYYSFSIGGILYYIGDRIFWIKKPRLYDVKVQTMRTYRLLSYLCTVAPMCIWVFTFFSYRIFISFHQIEIAPATSFFVAKNLWSYVFTYYPFLSPAMNTHSLLFYFSIWGTLMGLISSTRLIHEELHSNRAYHPERIRHILFEPWDAEERRFQVILSLGYAFLVFWLVVRPLFTLPKIGESQVPRIIVGIYLLFPVFFNLGLWGFRRFQAGKFNV
jgi:hypothetical protein